MSFFKKKRLFYPEFTQEYCEPDEKNQTQEIKGFKNGKYIGSVVIHYFTKEQLTDLSTRPEIVNKTLNL